MKEFDYNKPIPIIEVSILDQINELRKKTIVFEYDNMFFRYEYASSGNMGGIHITKYDNMDVALSPLSRTGKEETIYNTFNQSQCTDLGRYIQYSIMKWQI